MKPICRLLVIAALLVAGTGVARAQAPATRTLSLVFEGDGSVSLRAQNVTVREIFAEWALKCGCFVVNAAQLAGAPIAIPVMFDHAPQAAVLESLLRQAAGYVLTPRRTASVGPSNYDVIYILATSTATAPSPAYGSTSFQPAPIAAPIVTAGSPDDEIPPVQPPRTANAPLVPPTVQQQPPPAPRPNSPGVSIVPIVPVGNAPPATAPGTSSPAPRQ